MTERTVITCRNIDLQIAYDHKEGGEESILFIHGLGACKDCFEGALSFPGFEKYTIVALDLPGFGDSDSPEEFDYTMENYSATCRLLIEKLNLKKLHIVAHSMGGAVGLLLVNEIPERILSYISLEGNLIAEDCTLSKATISHSQSDFIENGFNKLKAKIRRSIDISAAHSNSMVLFSDWLAKSAPGAFYKCSESLVALSTTGELLEMFQRFNKNKCYIYGEMNRDMPVIGQLDTIPKLMIEDAGHPMMTDNPVKFYRELLKVLQP